MATNIKEIETAAEAMSYQEIKNVEYCITHFDRFYFFLSPTEKIALVKKGVSKKLLIRIKEEAALNNRQLSKVLATSKANLTSEKGIENFSQETIERVLLLNDIISYGQAVFGDKEHFKSYLKSPIIALGDVTPLYFMKSYKGMEEVGREIGRLAYGIY
jgi:putative toxin-antitoxin system antitoxin component (TIGR02293 family)